MLFCYYDSICAIDSVCVCVCMHICMHVCLYACMYVCIEEVYRSILFSALAMDLLWLLSIWKVLVQTEVWYECQYTPDFKNLLWKKRIQIISVLILYLYWNNILNKFGYIKRLIIISIASFYLFLKWLLENLACISVDSVATDKKDF